MKQRSEVTQAQPDIIQIPTKTKTEGKAGVSMSINRMLCTEKNVGNLSYSFLLCPGKKVDFCWISLLMAFPFITEIADSQEIRYNLRSGVLKIESQR